MDDQAKIIARIKQVKHDHQEMLMAKANVVGVGIGYAQRGQKPTDQLSLVVMVSQKLPLELLDAEDIIPRELEGILVDIQVSGELWAGN